MTMIQGRPADTVGFLYTKFVRDDEKLDARLWTANHEKKPKGAKKEDENMTRDQVRAIIGESATDEQINAILNAHSADIGELQRTIAAHEQTEAELNARIITASQTIAGLETAAGDAEQMRTELEKYRTAEQQRTAAEQAAALEAQTANRFAAAAGETRFVNDYTRDGVLAQFRAAIADPANAGRGDAEVLAGLIKDKPGLLANPNPGVDIPGPAALNNQVLTVEAFNAMPLHEQMKWANTNPEMYARISAMLK